jgi:uncharacterized protein
VAHNEASSRFEVVVDGHLGELVYRRDRDRILLVHTGVPEQIERRGIGSALVAAAVGYAIEEGIRIVPVCWFVRGWLERHPKTAAQASIDWAPSGGPEANSVELSD